jgi:hypothetical protein
MDERVWKESIQISLIFDTILSSGDGLSKETAFTITSITAEFNIVSCWFSAVKAVLVDNSIAPIEVSHQMTKMLKESILMFLGLLLKTGNE